MKNVQFSKVEDGKAEVTVDGASYGKLEFDSDQKVWVLWPNAIDDGVSYFEDLEETEEAITYEIQNADEE